MMCCARRSSSKSSYSSSGRESTTKPGKRIRWPVRSETFTRTVVGFSLILPNASCAVVSGATKPHSSPDSPSRQSTSMRPSSGGSTFSKPDETSLSSIERVEAASERLVVRRISIPMARRMYPGRARWPTIRPTGRGVPGRGRGAPSPRPRNRSRREDSRRGRGGGAARTRREPGARSARAGDGLDGVGVLDGGEVAGGLAEEAAADRAADALGGARLGQRVDEAERLRAAGLAERALDGGDELLAQRLGLRAAGLQHHENDDGLALDRVGDADRGGFARGGVRDDGGLDLGGADALARDLDRVVAAAVEEPEAVVVDVRPVAVVPDAREAREVRVEVALAVVQEPLRHAGAGLLADEVADAAADRAAVLAEHVAVHAKAGHAERRRLERRDGKRRQEAADELGAARDVDHGAAAAADLLEVPVPRLGVPRLAGRAEDA